MKTYHLTAALVAVLVATPALATVAPASEHPAPAKAQAPKPMTREQFLASVKARFDAIDTNHDGVLEQSELAAAQQKQVARARAIQQQRLEAEFAKLDTNHDGQLSKAEFMAALPPIEPRVTAAQILGALDKNHDGKVSLQEYEAGPLENFAKLDANHDGVITAEELRAAQKR